MPSILVVCYDTTTGRYLVQKAGSAQITDKSITSAHLASGAVIGDIIAAAAITSSKIASGQVGMAHIYPGAVTSAKIASGIVGTVHLRDLNVTSAKLAAAIISLLGTVADEAITSAKLASGAVGTVHMWPGAVTSAILASGQVGVPHIYPGAIISAKIAANVIATPHILNQGILSASIGANQVGGAHILDGSILSSEIGAAAVGGAKLWDYGLTSGKYASGSITEQALVSGISIDIAEISQEPSYRAAALISAFLGIQFSTSGYFSHTQAADVDTMPAVGLTIANIASGAIGTFQHQGRMANPDWDFSGYVGKLLFIGTSSQVTLTAPTTSGESVQRVGKVIDPTTVFVKPELAFVQIAE